MIRRTCGLLVSVTVSPRCFSRVALVNEKEGHSNALRYLRLEIESGGCSGFVYKFKFDTDPIDPIDDIVFTESGRIQEESPTSAAITSIKENVGDGVICDVTNSLSSSSSPTLLTLTSRVVVDKGTLEKLDDAVLDYFSELKGSAFVVVGNQLVDHACACKQSFSMKKTASWREEKGSVCVCRKLYKFVGLFIFFRSWWVSPIL